jgi:hypothetical protein
MVLTICRGTEGGKGVQVVSNLCLALRMEEVRLQGVGTAFYMAPMPHLALQMQVGAGW